MALLPSEIIDFIATARGEHPKLRARDLAALIGLTEAHLLAADIGPSVVRIDAHPDRLMPMVCQLGEVMALTRNESCVHERRGAYANWHSGPHASMVTGPDIDLRIFAQAWVHGFAVTGQNANGPTRSLQVFDAAGDAVHKAFLEGRSDVAAYDRMIAALRLPDQDQPFGLTARLPAEAAIVDASKADRLRTDWAALTDTHQFLALTRRLKINRLGAYHIAGAPFAQALQPGAVTAMLQAAAARAIKLMAFVGNPGCIQIHSGLVETIKAVGPWQNVLDPRFNLHLREDHIAEVWLVNKPTARGPAISVEAFDAKGSLIVQFFGKRAEAATDTGDWDALTRSLPLAEQVSA